VFGLIKAQDWGWLTGKTIGFIVGGTLLVEIVFSYPGLGFLLFRAVGAKDYPLMQGIFLVITIAYSASWMVWNKREERREVARKADMIERGYGPSDEEASIDEKGKAVRRNEGRVDGTSNGVGEPGRDTGTTVV